MLIWKVPSLVKCNGSRNVQLPWGITPASVHTAKKATMIKAANILMKRNLSLASRGGVWLGAAIAYVSALLTSGHWA